MGALSLIDRLGLADEVLAMRAAGTTQSEIAAWVNAESRNESVTQAAVSRWLSRRDAGAKPPASPAAEKLAASAGKIQALTQVRVDRGGHGDARFFLNAARDLVGDLRAIYADKAEHPQLRAKALELALEAVAIGHEMAVDLLSVAAEGDAAGALASHAAR